MFFRQANKLACHSFMDAGRPEIPGSDTTDLIIQGTASSRSFMLSLIPLPLSIQDHGLMQSLTQLGAPYAMGFESQLRNPKLWETKSFIISSKQTCVAFAPTGSIIIVIQNRKKVTCLCSSGRCYSSALRGSRVLKQP